MAAVRSVCARITIIATLFLCALPQATRADVGQEFIALDHWCYDVLDRFEALGMCEVPADLPLTRRELIGLTDAITDGSFDRRLPQRDRYNLNRLQKEFVEFAARRDPQARYDNPVIYLKDNQVVLEGDLDLTPSLRNEFLSENDDMFLEGRPSLRLHWGNKVTYDLRYRLELGPERDDRVRDSKPSARERSWRGITSLYERGYLIAAFDNLHVYFGREYVDWGPADWGNLIVPGDAISLDQIGARITIKHLRFSFFHAQLSPGSARYLVGHRLEARLGPATVGFTEGVLYAGRGMDALYALPLASFYQNQFSERDDDNVLWSVDTKVRVVDGLVLYGSLLVDDFQYEGDGTSPDKLAFDVGGRWAATWPAPLTARGKYRFVDIYTYTHGDSATAWVSGDGLLTEGNLLLGGQPGPDSEGWRFELEGYPRYNVVVTGVAFRQRKGEGNDFRRHRPGDLPNPRFPLGVVEQTTGFGVQARYEFGRNSSVIANYTRASVDNIAHINGDNVDTNAYRVSIRWDF